MGTVDNIFILNSLVTHCLNNNEYVYCANLSTSPRLSTILGCKLITKGVRGRMLGNIKSMYSNVRSRVKHNGCLGEPFSSNTGVRQGEYLSPFLCYMYLNDLETEQATKDLVGTDIGSINIYYVVYADDINLFAKKKKK